MKRLIYVLVPLLALGGLIAWRMKQKTAEAAAQTKQREARRNMPAVVSVTPAALRDVEHTFEAIGTVESPFNVKIASKVTGRIDYLQAREGDRVAVGQVLVRIDPSTVQAQVRQAQAALAEAQFRLAQARLNQNPTNVGITTTIRQQEAAVASAEADFKQVTENYAAQKAAAAAAVTAAQSKVNNMAAAVGTADANIVSAKANLVNAQARYRRAVELNKRGFIAEQDLEDRRTTVDVQAAEVNVADSQRTAALAQKASSEADLDSAKQQASIVTEKGLADIAAARAKVTQARASLEAARANTAQRPAYEQNLAALQASVNAERAGLANAQSLLADTILRSPIEGFVTARDMDPGAVATSGSPILEVQSVRQVWVNVPIPEEVSRHVTVGQVATVAFDALPGRTFSGRVERINPSADPLSRQFAARIALANAGNVIKPGMFARVRFVTERVAGALVVPREAIQQGKAGATVMVVNGDGKAEKRPVQTGTSDPAGIAITSGLQPGEKVIVMSAMPLKEGQAVRAIPAQDAGASAKIQ